MKDKIIKIVLVIFFLFQRLYASEDEFFIDFSVPESCISNEILSLNDRKKFLEKNLVDLERAEDFDIVFCAHLIKSFDRNEYNLLAQKIAAEKNQNITSIISTQLLYNMILEIQYKSIENRQMTKQIYDRNREQLRSVAYYQAGRALTFALLIKSQAIGMLNIVARELICVPYGNEKKYDMKAIFHTINLAEQDDYSSLQDCDQREHLESLITVYSAGVAAHHIFAERIQRSWMSYLFGNAETRKDFSDFISKKSADHNIQEAEALAGKVVDLVDYSLGVDQKRIHIDQIMEKKYVQAFDIISAYKDKTEKIAEVLCNDYKISGEKIYEHAGISRPQYFYERDNFQTDSLFRK
ncbi:MAG: hypothetical protein JO129_03260 [Candidatus Dependentiae bacterium]|nr:hypothetical protein [Candidatus Dependentiae bacterium]